MKGWLNVLNNAAGVSYSSTAIYKRNKRKANKRKLIKFGK